MKMRNWCVTTLFFLAVFVTLTALFANLAVVG